MNIHYTIVKKAAAAGIILTCTDEDGMPDTVSAHHMAANVMVTRDASEAGNDDSIDAGMLNDIARDVWSDCQNVVDFNADPVNGDTKITFEDGDFVGYHDKQELARDPSFEDLQQSILEALVELGEGEEAEAAEEEDEPTGSVVPAVYKARYAAEGHPTHCGDWLAETLNTYCRVLDEKGKEVTDIDTLETIANANDVAPARYGKLGVETNGWQGRFRMTIRNMLAPRVATKGFLFVPDGIAEGDKEHTAPDEWRAKHMPKAKKDKAAGVVKPDAPEGKKGAKAQAKDAGDRGVAAATEAVKAARAKKQVKA